MTSIRIRVRGRFGFKYLVSEQLRAAVARLLSRLRAERGWSLRELAERSGLSIAYVSELENGRKLPTLETFAQLARAYDVSVAELLVALATELEGHEVSGLRGDLFRDLDTAALAELVRFAEYLRWRRSRG